MGQTHIARRGRGGNTSCSPIRSFDRLAEVAEELKGSLLYKHLKELNFVDAASAPAGAVVTRGAVVVRRRKGAEIWIYG